MARYWIESIGENGYPIITITVETERWEDILETLKKKDKIYPIFAPMNRSSNNKPVKEKGKI